MTQMKKISAVVTFVAAHMQGVLGANPTLCSGSVAPITSTISSTECCICSGETVCNPNYILLTESTNKKCCNNGGTTADATYSYASCFVQSCATTHFLTSGNPNTETAKCEAQCPTSGAWTVTTGTNGVKRCCATGSNTDATFVYDTCYVQSCNKDSSTNSLLTGNPSTSTAACAGTCPIALGSTTYKVTTHSTSGLKRCCESTSNPDAIFDYDTCNVQSCGQTATNSFLSGNPSASGATCVASCPSLTTSTTSTSGLKRCCTTNTNTDATFVYDTCYVQSCNKDSSTNSLLTGNPSTSTAACVASCPSPTTQTQVTETGTGLKRCCATVASATSYTYSDCKVAGCTAGFSANSDKTACVADATPAPPTTGTPTTGTPTPTTPTPTTTTGDSGSGESAFTESGKGLLAFLVPLALCCGCCCIGLACFKNALLGQRATTTTTTTKTAAPTYTTTTNTANTYTTTTAPKVTTTTESPGYTTYSTNTGGTGYSTTKTTGSPGYSTYSTNTGGTGYTTTTAAPTTGYTTNSYTTTTAAPATSYTTNSYTTTTTPYRAGSEGSLAFDL